MSKSKEKTLIFNEISGEKPTKILLSAYKTENFSPDIPGSDAVLQERLVFFASWGYEYVGSISGKSNNILIFKLNSDNDLQK
jgi:hypothetical protein